MYQQHINAIHIKTN